MSTTTRYANPELADAAETALEALDALRDALRGTDLQEALRHGGPGMPYSLRNLCSDLEGSAGGWLMKEGESFREQLEALRDLAAGLTEDDDEEEAE